MMVINVESTILAHFILAVQRKMFITETHAEGPFSARQS
jgi:hypothetical protein